ncbi:MAG TPA: elongation factor G [Rhizobiales bacterium]|nr:elongation factor G [Hyphomicrobiales bacterium]
MGVSGGNRTKGSRCIAIVGPYLSGKTTLLEAILFRTGAIGRQGRVTDANTTGDASPEARQFGMSVELNAATTQFMDETYTFVDCPGSIEFSQEAEAVLAVADAAIVVCEPDEKKTHAVQVILKRLDDLHVPRFLFVNKVDNAEASLRDVLEYLQPASETPLVLRQIPIREGGIATGFVDLALERAYVYREHAPSEVIDIPEGALDREKTARFEMLEKLADFDDELLEQLLSDMEPPRDKVFDDLSQDLAAGMITPVLFGSAENGNGILRLLKALRHEAPGIEKTRERLGFVPDGETTVQVMKTLYTAHGGKLSLVRVLDGEVKEGTVFYGPDGKDARAAGVFDLKGTETSKVNLAKAGDTVALGRMEGVDTGQTLSTAKGETEQLLDFTRAPAVYGMAIAVADHKDEVKLTSAIAKLIEEDPSLSVEHNPDTHEIVLWGQGEMHLRVALSRLAGKFGVTAQSSPRHIAYKETIRKSTTIRRRYKKQSGGHGQFGDVQLDIKPLPRGSGFAFSDTISGGVVPKQYIPAVEHGIIEYMARGPLGFPVIDIAVNLSDGSFHNVDSSEMAFKQAARMAMSDGMAECSPVLLEPIVAVEIHVPSEATPRANQIVSGHRGQLLGFDVREGWNGWDTIKAHIPESEISDLIIELRSATSGAGTFTFAHDHLSELTGRLADQAIEAHRKEAE